MLIIWTSYGKLIIFFSRNYFCLNQLACHHYKTIHKMRVSFHLVYRYIFCLPSRRLMQIIMQVLNIIYSFCSFSIITSCMSFNCHKTLFISQRFSTFFFFFCLTTHAFFFFFFWVRTTIFFFLYWHASHSLPSSSTSPLSHVQVEQEHTPYISECSCKEQWQSQLQFLHLFIVPLYNVID